MYILILTMVLWGDASQAGSGGVSVNTIKIETLEQCQLVKNEFLNNMSMTHKEITGSAFGETVITRKGSCVKIAPQR